MQHDGAIFKNGAKYCTVNKIKNIALFMWDVKKLCKIVCGH